MIGQLSSDSGISLVVPAYFVCAGILLYTGIVSAILGTYRARAPAHLAFAVTCLASAVVSFSFASYYLASSMHGGIEAQRWVVAAASVFMLALFVFVGIFTEASGMARAYAAAALVAAVFVAACFVLPNGVRWNSVQSYGWVYMPWGEALFRIDGEMGAWHYAMRAASVAVMAWTVTRLLKLHRTGRRRDALVLAIYIVVLFASSVQGAMIDRGWASSFHTVPVALVGLALLMSVSLGIRMREENLKLEDIAFTDAVTGLRNRRFIQERLARLIDAGPEKAHGAVLLCDFDHFKVVNDALSHAVGDELLREAAARLANLANGEASVVNIGADAFMLVPDRLFDDEAQAGERIGALALAAAHEMSRPYTIGERAVSLTASAGVATFAARATTATEVIGRAEMALERAKKRGRNNVQAFVPSLRQESAERFRVIEGLRRAIDAGELALHYQPQVDMSGNLVGAEALMRWSSPAMGNVPPSTFIPVAEETGLIHALGEWSLREGCGCLARWHAAGAAFDGHLSINVSPWQLARPDFVDRLCETLEATRVEPGHLTLEITESAVLFDVSETVAKLKQIRPLGVRIALDDFGTGYSSLALIKDLPLDAIKIDQSFVRHLEEGANKHLIRVAVAIGAELGLEIIAEGVETAAEVEALAGLGCTRLQGYFLGRPMPAAQFEAWLASRAAGMPLAERVSA